MLFHICHKDIRLRVEDLQSFAGKTVESGNNLLGGVGDIAPTGTETEIDAAWDVEFAELAILIENGTTVLTANVHHREVRILIGKSVTVHASVVQLLVMSECIRLEILHTSLLYLHVVPDLIVGFDEAIGEIGIYLVCNDLPMEGLVLYPPPVDEGRYRDVNLLSCRLFHQRLPVVDVKDGFVATGMDGETPCLNLDGLTVGAQQEVQRGDVLWDGHLAVVWVDRWQLVALLHILRCRGTGDAKGQYRQEID